MKTVYHTDPAVVGLASADVHPQDLLLRAAALRRTASVQVLPRSDVNDHATTLLYSAARLCVAMHRAGRLGTSHSWEAVAHRLDDCDGYSPDLNVCACDATVYHRHLAGSEEDCPDCCPERFGAGEYDPL